MAGPGLLGWRCRCAQPLTDKSFLQIKMINDSQLSWNTPYFLVKSHFVNVHLQKFISLDFLITLLEQSI